MAPAKPLAPKGIPKKAPISRTDGRVPDPEKPPKMADFQQRRHIFVQCVLETPPEEPFTFKASQASTSKNKEAAIKRTITINKVGFQKLDYAWLEGKSDVIVLKNVTGKGLRQHPDDETKEKIKNSVAYIAVGGKVPTEFPLELRPDGPPMVLCPKEGFSIYISVKVQPVEVLVGILPK